MQWGCCIWDGDFRQRWSTPATARLSTKAAQRILAEAMARELGPQGVHVAYVIVDAVIDLEWQRKRYQDRPDEFFIKPRAIADEIWHVVHQDRSAWSFNVELRPFGENW
jgi:short-subunit dehydrogenase